MGDLLPATLYIPYLRMLKGLANGPQCSHYCFSLLKTNGAPHGKCTFITFIMSAVAKHCGMSLYISVCCYRREPSDGRVWESRVVGALFPLSHALPREPATGRAQRRQHAVPPPAHPRHYSERTGWSHCLPPTAHHYHYMGILICNLYL